MLDCIMTNDDASVEWVRDNIEVFGGNASKITLWGQSSGAEAVDMYSMAWHEDPIVHVLIMDSGSALIEDGSGPRYSNFSYVANEVGCGNMTSPADELACMRKVDATKLEAVIEKNFNENGMHHGDGIPIASPYESMPFVIFRPEKK